MGIKATEYIYNGYPMLKVEWEGNQADKYPLALSIGKAKKALAAYEKIQAFVEAHKNDPRRPRPAAAPEATLNPDGTRTPAYREDAGGAREASGYRQ
jgi:hypothetical protein